MLKRTLILITIAAFLLAGCATNTPVAPTDAPAPELSPSETSAPEPTQEAAATEAMAEEGMTLTDGLGREVTVPVAPERIISLAPSNTEILFALDAGNLLVGRDDFSDYPPEALEVESIGSTYGEINTEAIVALEPDLVLAGGITPPEHIETIENLGIPVFTIGNPLQFDDLFTNLRTAGQVIGREREAANLVASMQTRLDAVLTAVEGVEPVRVFYEVDGTDPNAPWTTGSGTFQQMMFDLIGAENVFADIEGWAQVNLEDLLARDPEVIIFADGSFVTTTVESLAARPGWGEIAAVSAGEVYGVDTDLTDLPGPRLVEGLEALARILHPEVFE